MRHSHRSHGTRRRGLRALLGRVRRALTTDRGAVIPITAAGITVMLLGAAFATDVNRLGDERRNLERDIDLIVLDAARELIGGEEPLDPAARREAVTEAAIDSARRNGLFGPGPVDVVDDGTTITLTQGTAVLELTPYGWDDAAKTVVPGASTPVFLHGRASDSVDFLFWPGTYRPSQEAVASRLVYVGDTTPPGGPTTTTTPPGVCPVSPCWIEGSNGGFQLGSFLVGIDRTLPDPDPEAELFAEVKTRFMNAAAGVALGADTPDGHLAVDLVGWRGLGTAAVTLGELATELGFGTVSEMLDAEITFDDLLVAAATALTNRGDTVAANVLDTIRSDIDGTTRVRLGDTLRVAQGADGSAARSAVNVAHLFMSATMAAAVADGNNLLSTTVDLPIANPLTGEPTLSATWTFALIEPPVTFFGPALYDEDAGAWTTSAETAQVRSLLTIDVPGINLPVLGGAVTAQIPVYTTGASARADLTSIACSTPVDASEVGLSTVTDGIVARVATTSDLLAATPNLLPAPVLSVTLPLIGQVDVTATAEADVGGSSGPVTFADVPFNSWAEDLDGDGRPDGTPPHTRIPGGTAADLGAALLSDLHLAGGLDPVTMAALESQLAFVFDDLAPDALNPLASALGVGLGGADLDALNLDCHTINLIDPDLLGL